MRLVSCEHPKIIRNPHSGEVISVPCRHCDSCFNSRARRWISRIDLESQRHKICYMVTFTYDDEHLPKLMFCEDDPNYLEIVGRNSDRIPLQELLDLCKTDADRNYLCSRLTDPLGLPCHCSEDIQKFNKRLNKYIHDNINGEYQNFRYFICSEYGPSTYRIHYHGLFWLDKRQVISQFNEALSACWTFGNVTADAVYSNGGKSYVAQYVNMSVHLPSFYVHNKIRQRLIFSKNPSIGSLPLLDEEVRKLYDRLPIKRTVFDSQSAKYVVVPISPTVKNRFFPKCPEYHRRSYSDRVKLYGVCNFLPSGTFGEFRQAVNDLLWLESRRIQNRRENLYLEVVHKMLEHSRNEETFCMSLRRWFQISHRLIYFTEILNTSLDWIVSRIDEFYSKINYDSLLQQYDFQQSYTLSHSSSDLVYMYPEFVKSVNQMFNGNLDPSFMLLACDSLGIQPSHIPKLESTFDYRQMKQQAAKIYKDTHKRHRINAYLYQLKNKNPRLAEIINNYHLQKTQIL